MQPRCFFTLARRLRARAVTALVAFFLVALAASLQHVTAAPVVFVVDNTQSYLSLAVPNFTEAGTTVNLTGQNRTNGAPVTNAWSSTTGNRASIDGTFKADLGGSVTPGGVSSVQFVSGTANLVALSSGNYRPNPAAYDPTPPPPLYTNRSTVAGNYGATIHASIGNVGLFSLSSTTYALSSGAIPVSADQFSVNLSGNALTTGLSTTTFAVQGIELPLGAVIPNELSFLTGLSANNTSSTKGTIVITPGQVKITIPISVPFSIPLAGGSAFMNGIGTGQIVAFYVPEPSTIYLGGLGAILIGGAVRRSQTQRARRRGVAERAQ